MPYDELFKGFHSVSNKIIISILTITIIMIILAVLLSNTMTRGLKKLLVNIRNVERGNLSVNIESSKIIEVEILNISFEEMMKKVRNLLKEIEIANKKERDAELMALQAQINPHFLYNTLDAVYWMTDDKDVGEIISSLGRFFRLSLNKGMDVVSVTHELEHVRKYVDIQLKIYRNRFEFIEVIDDNVSKFHILKLILQPLVENAILHGLNQKKTNGLIKLTAGISGENLIFSVEDNGTGVVTEDMQSILNNVVETKGYGIRNVNERIKIKYGNQYGLYYENKESGGAIARIILPLIGPADT
jgi:two-component system sensor histidine kinase YesM